jgi:acetyl-CoA C-acetyltransferase
VPLSVNRGVPAVTAASGSEFAKALEVIAKGVFKDEIATLEIAQKKGPVQFAVDEHPRPNTTLDRLQELKPLFPNGVVTAGNASGINDGAGALIVGTREAGEKAGTAPLARVVSAAIAGVEPRVMGLGPVPAAKKALQRAGLSLKDMDVIEINEAFATQVLCCLKLLELPEDDARVNPNGGAIAVGHPLGASGARIALTAIRELHRRNGRYALVSMCIGVGQGIAAVIERV